METSTGLAQFLISSEYHWKWLSGGKVGKLQRKVQMELSGLANFQLVALLLIT